MYNTIKKLSVLRVFSIILNWFIAVCVDLNLYYTFDEFLLQKGILKTLSIIIIFYNRIVCSVFSLSVHGDTYLSCSCRTSIFISVAKTIRLIQIEFFSFFFGKSFVRAGAGWSYWGLTMGLGSLIVRSIASFQLTVNVNAVVPCLCNFLYIIYITPSRFVAVSV